MKLLFATLLVCAALFSSRAATIDGSPDSASQPQAIFGFRDAVAQNALESRFLAIPDPKRAEEHLRILTQAPHVAGSPEDKATADYVATKFREAGLDTEIVEYRVWMNYPAESSVEMTAPAGVAMRGPKREYVGGDPYQDDERIIMPFSGMSPSGDVEADVVYANYGTPADFKRLEQMNIDVRGKIVLVRYGQNFRGVKVLVAQERGAAGTLIYSDPYDDGWRRGDKYPQGPWRPDSGVQRGSVGFMFNFPGDPTTPGIASIPSLKDSKRIPPGQSAQLPKILSIPISYADAWPILEHLGGPDSPREWQGSLPFTYHIGPGPAKVRMHAKQDYQFRTIWNVIGRIHGSQWPGEWVVAGNHRDAWVFGAVDPNSGTVAMLECVHSIGELLKAGFRPKRTIVFASWDGEEEGLIGSTEWGEQHEKELASAAAYFNVDVAVSGPKFGASSVPSLKAFLRDITKAVPSPQGGTLYEAWQKSSRSGADVVNPQEISASTVRPAPAQTQADVVVGDLGSGSDYAVFLEHLGVPSADMGSTGSYGVYHSVFDNFNWFKKFADPEFLYEQEMARVYGLAAIRMANSDVLPYDYETYGKEVQGYIEAARKRCEAEFGAQCPSFSEVADKALRFQQAGAKIAHSQSKPPADPTGLNQALGAAERALLVAEGLPERPWYRHVVYAPGRYTGYAAVVIPGVNEAIDSHDVDLARRQIATLAAALARATKVLSRYH